MDLILQRMLKLKHHRAARDRGRSLISTIALFSYHFFSLYNPWHNNHSVYRHSTVLLYV